MNCSESIHKFVIIKFMIRTIFLLSAVFLIASCSYSLRPEFPKRISGLSGSDFYKKAGGMNWISRDSLVVNEVLKGNIPDFLKQFVTVQISGIVNDKTVEACIFVAPDYLSVGSDDDWARVCITPMAAQKIADSLHCFLPTRKIVDHIFNASKVKLEPVPMFAYRDSTPTMWHHHLIIEGQRKGRKGLISGIKKDVVLSDRVLKESKQSRVAIYGWHYPDGKPIQALHTAHKNWYVDYSHGIRLIFEKILIGGKWLHYSEVFKHPVYRILICDEGDGVFYHYNY
jgi:hypothetical protein